MLTYKKTPSAVLSLLLAGALFTSCATVGKSVVVKPVEIDSTLLNPGRGFTSTGSAFNVNFKDKMHPLAGIHQQRVYWGELEPQEGKINYGLIDSAIANCVRNGQTLNFRVMVQNVEMKIPKWALDAGVASPFYDNPVFLEKHLNLIKALGQRYDGHPGVSFVDIGTVGQWGEWHVSDKSIDSTKIVYPSEASVKRIIDTYFSSFKKTPLVMLIGLKKNYGYKYATSNGAGWRADCWGDMDSLGWNHMKGVYPQAIENAKAHDSWKRGPIAFETCWTMVEWYKRGWDLDYILNKALEWHATGVNNGSEEIPAEWYPKVKEFEKKLGYRLVLDELTYPSNAKKGEAINCTMKWENKGVAPVYNIFEVAIQLVSKADANKRFTIATDADLKKIFPGSAEMKSSFTIPAQVEAGEYEVELGVVDPATKKPVVNLAIAGKTSDGWYKMGAITVSN
jgi:hypothetical protein